MIPNPDLSNIPVVRERTFEFGSGAKSLTDPTDKDPWGVKTDGGTMLQADYGRVSAAPTPGTREIWTLKNAGAGWDHPVHIHFEEGQILARNGSAANVPAWEKGRKDVYRLRPGGSVTLTMQFREFYGMFMEHCHNTVHEDHAMLVRWELDRGLVPMPTPIPTPQGVGYIASTTLPTAFNRHADQCLQQERHCRAALAQAAVLVPAPARAAMVVADLTLASPAAALAREKVVPAAAAGAVPAKAPAAAVKVNN